MRRQESVWQGVMGLGLAAVLGLEGATVHADEVLLNDGSRIVGQVQSYYQGKWKIKTAWGGEMTLAADVVAQVQTDQPVMVQLKDGGQQTGPLVDQGPGLHLLPPATTQSAALQAEQITAVWPQGAASPQTAEAEAKHKAQEWKFRAELGLNGETGNSEQVAANGLVEAKRTTDVDRWRIYAEGHYSRDNGKDTRRQIIAGTRYEYDLSPRWYTFGDFYLENDEFEKIDLRANLTGGMGYFFIRQDDLQFKGFAGPGVQYTNFSDGGGDQTVAILTLGEDLKWVVTPWLTFTHNIRYDPTLDTLGDYRLIMENAGEMPVSKDGEWRFRLGMRNTYVGQPVDGADHLDTIYFLNLVWETR